MIYIPDLDNPNDKAMRMPYLHTHKVARDSTTNGQNKEMFIYATDENYNMEHEGFYGWMYTHNGFIPVQAIWDGGLYIHRAKESEIRRVVGFTRFDIMSKLAMAVDALLAAQINLTYLQDDETNKRESVQG